MLPCSALRHWDGQQVSDVESADELSWARLGLQVVEELARQGFAQQAVQAALDATEAKVIPRSPYRASSCASPLGMLRPLERLGWAFALPRCLARHSVSQD